MRIIVNSGGHNYGWFSPEKLRELVVSGGVHLNEFAWIEHSLSWITVGEALAQMKMPVRTVKLKISRKHLEMDTERTTGSLSGPSRNSRSWQPFSL